ncbi:SMP-30/gluconolactonase/LRE family protein [Mesonia aestuariivivens]|nr:SMP-30/gluconolactonase/LRE family protein [Mesonia aestuariivivens]
MRKHLLILAVCNFLLLTVGCKTYNSPIQKGAKPELISNEFEFTEGPASDREGNVYFTDQPNNQILKWDAKTNSISVYMKDSGRSNGMYFDDNENLWTCADENFQLWKITPEKKVSVILDGYKSKNFNGPNDLWIDEKGGIYFTDPYYQRDYWNRTSPDMEKRSVYYLSPDHKTVKSVAEGFVLPNGIIGSSKNHILYVSDISNEDIHTYKIEDDGTLSNKRLFANMGSDGMTLDSEGNLYVTGNGVTIFDKKGNKIDHIEINKNWTGNVTFGGANEDILFITASDAVYTLKMKTHGIRWNH